MPLPNLDAPIHVLTLPLSKKTIKYKPFLVGEEVSFLTAIEMGERDSLIETFFTMVKSCILDAEVAKNVDQLSLIDFLYLLMNIRAKSKKETVDLIKTCVKCEKEFPFEFDIISSLFLENEDSVKKVVEMSDDLILTLGPLKSSYFRDFLTVTDETQKILLTIANMITVVNYRGEVYKEFTPDEVTQKILKRLTKKQLEKLSSHISGMVNIKCKVATKCPECGHEDEVTTTEFFDFLE